MRLRGCVFCALLLPTALAATAAGPVPAGWREYIAPDKSFTVLLPDQKGNQVEDRPMITIGGVKGTEQQVVFSPLRGPSYTAACLLLSPMPTQRVPPDRQLRVFRDAYVWRLQGKVRQEKAVQSGDLKGTFLRIVLQKKTTDAAIFCVGARIYIATASGSQRDLDSPEVDVFFKSFQFPTQAE